MKHIQTIEVHSPDEVPEAGRGFVTHGTRGTSGWLDRVKGPWPEFVAHYCVTHWHYTDALKPPPKPEPVTVRMRPGTERPVEKDWPINVVHASGQATFYSRQHCDSALLHLEKGALWFPCSEAIPREPWRHEETVIGMVTPSRRLVIHGESGMTIGGTLPPEGTRIRVTMSMEEVRDGD